VTMQAHETAPGYVFIAPKRGSLAPKTGPGQDGPMIIDSDGQLVWFYSLQDEGKSATDFKVQHYKGEPVLTWWEGILPWRNGGEYVILDGSYREITRVRAGNGYKGDLHEFLITPRDTALITVYNAVRTDLSSIGGPEDGTVLDGIAQEVDVETGEVLFEWHSLDHVALDECYSKPPTNLRRPFDYFHINSIDVDHDSNLLIDAKKTFTVYKVDRNSGEVIWRLGGKNSNFEMGPGTRTRHQHDARRQPDGSITIFDNNGGPGLFISNNGEVTQQSRSIALELDEDKMTATLVREYTHPKKLQAALEGNMQVLQNGNVFIGWGSVPVFSEFSSDGELLFNASFITKQQSYRAFRFPWSGQPSDDPAVAAESGPDDEVTVYASWNGATEVATWQVLAGPGPGQLRPVGSAVPRGGFETAIVLHTTEPYVGVQAKNGSGSVLGISKAVKPGD
jgi:hypothetical protein